jgi:outer membrane protein TolC
MSLPLFDGGMRQARLKEAESRAALAKADFDRIQNAALTEIILAQNALRTALESYRAASTLEQTAAITFDAALDAYRHGIGTVDIATAADTALLDAQQAKVDAHTQALIGALKLAFVIGALTSDAKTAP